MDKEDKVELLTQKITLQTECIEMSKQFRSEIANNVKNRRASIVHCYCQRSLFLENMKCTEPDCIVEYVDCECATEDEKARYAEDPENWICDGCLNPDVDQAPFPYSSSQIREMWKAYKVILGKNQTVRSLCRTVGSKGRSIVSVLDKAENNGYFEAADMQFDIFNVLVELLQLDGSTLNAVQIAQKALLNGWFNRARSRILECRISSVSIT